MIAPQNPAFPYKFSDPLSDTTIYWSGLTKREYFAAMALQGILTNVGRSPRERDTAEWAVMLADALIRELDKKVSE